jgi:serine phosphatase RsbU (regulator of sigma subunit)/anti-sigma regulatory factor (Ser/Thr protein kinase)
MATLRQALAGVLHRARSASENQLPASSKAMGSPGSHSRVEIAPDDPLLAYFEATSSATDVADLDLDSPARTALLAAGVRLVVPMVSQGELVGLLNLGPRRADVDYSHDDRRLLESLAAQAAPAVRVAQLVRQRQAEIRAHASVEQELRLARVIQQYFLPKAPPDLPGWEVSAHYRPARAVGGDFYDFIPLPDGQLGIVIGDVADKGVPAALVMAATRSLLRASAQRLVEPADVLARVNDLVVPDTPPHMFVTCMFAVLDLASGRLRYANAGHDPPYIRAASGDVVALQARGLPLGVMSDYVYVSHERLLAPLDTALFYSDGLVEAHNPQREMFSFERLKDLVAGQAGGTAELICAVLSELDNFVGQDWQQEDDVTLVSLKRMSATVLTEFGVAPCLGEERAAIARILNAVQHVGLAPEQTERLKTATAEAIVNAIEHLNMNSAEQPVRVQVRQSATRVTVAISNAVMRELNLTEPVQPDLVAKLEGRDDPRGWGRFLMKRLTDDIHEFQRDGVHTVELSVNLEAQPTS